jgi:hypothetical protein
MSKECGVKVGTVRGKYNSKYKTEEEKLNARRERQKEYYERKKSNPPEKGDKISKAKLTSKEKLMKQVEILTHENNILRDELAYYKSIAQQRPSSKIIVKEDKESFDDYSSSQYISNDEKSEDVENVKVDVEIPEKKKFSEEEIKKYERSRNKSIKNFGYNWDIEKIIADRNRELVD